GVVKVSHKVSVSHTSDVHPVIRALCWARPCRDPLRLELSPRATSSLKLRDLLSPIRPHMRTHTHTHTHTHIVSHRVMQRWKHPLQVQHHPSNRLSGLLQGPHQIKLFIRVFWHCTLVCYASSYVCHLSLSLSLSFLSLP